MVIWGVQGDGKFGVKYAYLTVVGGGWEQQKQLCDKVWQLATWAKISAFWWIIFNQKLLSWDFLIMKGFMGPYMCML
jgi:hypothetical protein